MKQIYFKYIFIILFLLTSCGKKAEVSQDTVEQNAGFFGIVYQTTASRIMGTTPWIATNGLQRMLVNHTGNVADTNSGSYTFQFETYKEPQLYNTNLCSGGYSGTVNITQTTDTTVSTVSGNTPYDPSATYVPLNPTPSSTDPSAGGVDPITGIAILPTYYSFDFDFTVASRSLSAGCNAVTPLASFTLNVIRLTKTGDLIVTNSNKGIEYYMIPQLK
jgi:hypothetical protein